MIIRFCLFLFLLVAIVSCQQGQKDSQDSDSVTGFPHASLSPDTYSLALDEKTSFANFMSYPELINGKIKLLMFSTNENALLIYDIESQSLQGKINYEREGPNALTALGISAGFKYVNQDTIIYYSQEQHRIFLTNDSGEVYSRLKLPSEDVRFGSIDMYSPMAYRKGSIYMQSLPIAMGLNSSAYNNLPNQIAKIDLKTGQFEKLDLDYPQGFKRGDYSQQLEMIDLVYNSTIDKFIISFPISDSIYVTDFEGYRKSYLAKSNLVKEFKKMDENNSAVSASRISNYYYWLSDGYGRLMFDPITGYYMREARAHLKESDYLERNFFAKKEVVVLDFNFEQVSTIPHSGALLMYYFFNENQVFWNKSLKTYNIDNNNEDTLYFDNHVYRKNF